MVGTRFQSDIDKASHNVSGSKHVSGSKPRSRVSLSGESKAESTQRLQIGLFGLGSMVLLIGLATIIGNQADLTQESSVPQAAPTTEPIEVPTQSNPLADAGIVPDLPAETPVEEENSVVEDLPDSAVEDAEPLGEQDAP